MDDAFDVRAAELVNDDITADGIVITVGGVDVDAPTTAKETVRKLRAFLAAELRRASADGEARGEARGLERAKKLAAISETDGWARTAPHIDWDAVDAAIRALRATPAEPARSYEDGVRDGLAEAMRAVDAMKSNRPEWHDVHSPIDQALTSAVDCIRALRSVPR